MQWKSTVSGSGGWEMYWSHCRQATFSFWAFRAACIVLIQFLLLVFCVEFYTFFLHPFFVMFGIIHATGITCLWHNDTWLSPTAAPPLSLERGKKVWREKTTTHQRYSKNWTPTDDVVLLESLSWALRFGFFGFGVRGLGAPSYKPLEALYTCVLTA